MSMNPNDTELEARLAGAAAPGAVAWERVRRRLTEAAELERLVDVAFERHETPLGTLVVGATGDGLVRVGLPAEDEEAVLDDLASRISPRVLHASRDVLHDVRAQLDGYFERRLRTFSVP